jgi:hypothetical protein
VATTLVLHTTHSVKLEPMAFDADIFRTAGDHAVTNAGVETDLFGDNSVTLFTRKSPGNMGICYAAKNNRETGVVCFTLDVSDSDNIISDKGVLMIETPIPAGESRQILHVAPADDEYSWTCGLFCKARTILESEYEEMKKEGAL